ncbi:MAG: ATP-binding cassette domain-containing protein [Gammaproteobacteria bacterium]
MTDLYQFEDVCFEYGQAFRLGQINLTVEQGSFIAFVGPNGSGKSTLLNLFAMLELPTQGKLGYRGKVLTKMNVADLKKQVGYVQQNPYLLRGTVQKNIELGLKLQHVDKSERLKRVAEVMDLMQISSYEQRNVRDLSGGEAQKVAISRALVLEPEVLILDEPFTFLDKNSIKELETLLARLHKEYGKTIILTTHNQIQAQLLSESLYSVVQGKVFASGFVNLYSGKVQDDNRFDTGKIIVNLSEASPGVEQIAIDPKQVVLSRDKLDSSMQNSFCGSIRSMVEEDGHIKVIIHAGEEFHVIITHQALQELGLFVGQDIWLSFKSSSIIIC